MVESSAPHGRTQVTQGGYAGRNLENAEKRGPGGEKRKNRRASRPRIVGVLGITGDWSTAALDPGVWYRTVYKGGCRFMAARVREEEKASENRQSKREADKVEVAPGVTVARLKRFRAALIGPTQGLTRRASAALREKPESTENAVL